MDLSNTSVPESFTIYRNFIHFRQPARPPPVRSEQLRPCRQKPKTQRVRRPARSGGGRAQGEPRCKPERGSRKCAWAMWRRGAAGVAGACKKRRQQGRDGYCGMVQEARAGRCGAGCRPFCKKGLAKKLQSAAAGQAGVLWGGRPSKHKRDSAPKSKKADCAGADTRHTGGGIA